MKIKELFVEMVAAKQPPNAAPWHIKSEGQVMLHLQKAGIVDPSVWTRNSDGSYSTRKKNVNIFDDLLVETGDGGWGLPFAIRNCNSIRITSSRLTSLKGFPSNLRAGSEVFLNNCSSLTSLEDVKGTNLQKLYIDCAKLESFNPTLSWVRQLVLENSGKIDLNEIVKSKIDIRVSIQFVVRDQNAVKQLKKGILKFNRIPGKPHLHLFGDSTDKSLERLDQALTIFNKFTDEGTVIDVQEALLNANLEEFAQL